MNFNLFSNLVNPLAGDSASAWEDLIGKISNSVDAFVGSLFGIFTLSAIVVTIFYAAKGGFTNDPGKRKGSLIAMAALWGLVIVCIIVWSLRGSIINLVAGAAPAPNPGSFFNFLTIS